MNYLFFDIECASVGKNTAKICAFGYCLTDTDFRIIEKEDILINPKGGFHLTDRKGAQGLVLPYEYSEFKNYPTFPEVEGKIRSLLEDKNTLPVGHASLNDVKFLNFESRRFSLPSFKFSFADTQFVYMNRIGDFSRQFALGTIAGDLGVTFTAHRAVDDAYATMCVAKALCEEANTDFFGLVKKYGVTLGKIADYTITPYFSRAQKADRAKKEKEKLEKGRARKNFHVYAERYKRIRNSSPGALLSGKSVCFSRTIEGGQKAISLLKRVWEVGGKYVYHVDECNVYVVEKDETGARVHLAKEAGADVLEKEEFEKMLEGKSV